MEIPITIATVIALTHSNGKTYIDETETFIFFGQATQLDTDDVFECAAEMVRARTDDLSDDEIEVIAKTPTAFDLKEYDFTEGQISVRWETRL